MAQQYNDPIGGELIVPGSYPSIAVAPSNSGLATTGVIVVLGEADGGPAFDQESDLTQNIFGSDNVQAIQAKYLSGPIVDACNAASEAAVDPDITETFQYVIPVKTNKGTQASTSLVLEVSGANYGGLSALYGGILGNLIYYTIADAVATVSPTTGSFTYIPQPAAMSFSVNQNGSLSVTDTTAIDGNPSTLAGVFSTLSVTGGTARTGVVPTPGTNTLAIAIVSAGIATFTLSVPWAGSVGVGDTLEIPHGSSFVGASGQNEGWYVVTAVAGAVVTATKLGDKSTTTSHVAGAVINPVAVSSTTVPSPSTSHINFYMPVSFTWNGTPLDGLQRTFEVNPTSPLSGDTNALNAFRQLGVTASVTWLSTSTTPYVVQGIARQAKLDFYRKVDNSAEEYIVGGECGMSLGYKGYSCTVTTNTTQMSITYQLTNVSTPVTTVLPFAQYPTIGDIASYVNSLSNFTAAPGTSVLGNLPSTALDDNTYYAVTSAGAQCCRIKTDAYRLMQAMAASALVTWVTAPVVGLPADVPNPVYFAGGARGATTVARIQAAVAALEGLTCNFIVPCISSDATVDIANGVTDPGSTYQLEATNQLIKAHVHKMSGMKTRRNRQCFLSKRDTYVNDKTSAGNLASWRCSLSFQDTLGSFTGATIQYPPYIAAVNAAAAQAGAFYKAIVLKQINATGAIQAAGDWGYNFDSQLADALTAGLLPIKKAVGGGFCWASDQTTYGKDPNNYYNSIQMVYAGDIVALTTAQRMETAFGGKSVADVSASVALSYLDAIMLDFMRLKLIAASDDAPLGYRNAKVQIVGPAMRVSVEIKLAGAIYFIPIAFYVTPITQTA